MRPVGRADAEELMGQFMDARAVRSDGPKYTSAELQRAIRQAIAAEQEAVSLYEQQADLSDDPLVTRVLRDIAGEERVHVGELLHLLRHLTTDEQVKLEAGAEEVKKAARELADELEKNTSE